MFKRWWEFIKRTAIRIKTAFVGLVVSLLAIVGVYVGIPDAEPGVITITYERATENVDGTTLALEDIEETRLWCEGELVAQEAGADGDFEFTAVAGQYSCIARHIANGGQWSDPSAPVTYTIEAPKPKPPVLTEG